MTTSDAAIEIDSWARACADVIALLEGDAARLARRAEAVSGWSAVEHAAHLTLANELVLRNLRNLGKGSGMLVVPDAEQNEQALAILAGGTLPRGARSPRMVVPPLDIDVPTALEWARKHSSDLATFTGELESLPRPRCFVPHQVLGPLDLTQWARFARVHTHHHLAIARSVLASH